MITVCSGFCQNLNLSIPTPHFRVDRGSNNAELGDHVGLDLGGGMDAGRHAYIAYGNAVPLQIEIGDADARNGCVVRTHYLVP